MGDQFESPVADTTKGFILCAFGGSGLQAQSLYEAGVAGVIRPKVTIGVCTRNCASYISEALDSIVAQDYPHNHLNVVVVDESDDETPEIIRECISGIDIPVRVFRVFGRGLGASRNKVIENAEGDFVLWVDGDMVLEKDFVKKQVEFMENNPQIAAARGRQVLEPASGLLASLETYSRAAGRMVDYQSKEARSKALGTGGAIYRVAALTRIGGFDERMVGYCEDWDLEIRAKEAGWYVSMTEAQYSDYERLGLTWKNLWRKYWLRGYYTHYFLHKHANKGLIIHHRMFPPAAFLAGLLSSQKLYRIIHKKVVFLLPIQHILKMTSWYIGYFKSHFSSYEPRTSA